MDTKPLMDAPPAISPQEASRRSTVARWRNHIRKTPEAVRIQKSLDYHRRMEDPIYRERQRELGRIRRALNNDKWNAAARMKRLLDPEPRRQYTRNHRARYKNAIYEVLGGKCLICASVLHLQRHHLDDRIDGRHHHYGHAELLRAQRGETVLLCRGCHLQISNLKAKIRRGQYPTMLEVLRKSIEVPAT